METIGKYQITGELGSGGFGRVFKALDPTVGRVVAIKVLNVQDDPSLIMRFEVEAKTSANLQHKNIVIVHEFGEQIIDERAKKQYLVMEYLSGRNLQEIINEKTYIAPLDKLVIMSEVAQGLQFAHEHGVVHRDVKPANIMRLSDGSVKIMDFGIARLMRGGTTRMTQAGIMIGTPQYMAPEQFTSETADEKCDVWAYGVVFYEFLTGVNPFHGDNAPQMIFRVTAEEPKPISTALPGLPRSLDPILKRLLAKNRDDRYASLEDVRFDLEPVLVELRRAQVDDDRKTAVGLIAEERLDEALVIVRRILELDQTDAQARQWRRELPERIKQQNLHLRVRTLIEQANADAARRDFTAAIDKLAEATRLDRTNQEIRARLDQIVDEQETVVRAARLVAEARKEFEQNSLTVAIEHAREAAQADPQNSDAPALADRIGQEMERRNAEARRKEGLNKAKGLLLVQSYESAIAVLRELEARYPQDAEIGERLEEARRFEATYSAQKKIDATILEGRELVRAEQYDRAIELLESLGKDIPQKSQVTELLTYARERLEVKEREAQVEALIRQAGDAPSGDFESGLRLVDRALDLDPSNEKALRVRKKLLAIRQTDQENRAIQRSVQDGRALLLAGKLDEAIAASTELRGKRPEHPSVVAFDDEVQRMVRERKEKRAREVEAARREAERLMSQGLAGEATRLLNTLTVQYPSERIFQDLLPKAIANEQEQKNRAEEQKKREAIQAAIARADDLASGKRWDHALGEVDRALTTWPNTAELLQAKERILQLKATQDAETDIQQLIARHEWEAAIKTADSLLSRYPGQAAIVALREQGRLQLEFERLLKDAQSLVMQGDIDRAEPAVDELLRRRPGDATAQRLKQEIQRKRKRLQDFAAAEQLCKRLRFQEAHDLIIRVLLEDPEDAEAAGLLKRIERERLEYEERQRQESLERERRQRIDRTLAEAAAIIKQRQYASALQTLEKLAREFPDEENVADALRRAREAMAQAERTETRAHGKAELDALIKQHRYEDAIAKAGQLEAAFPEENFHLDREAAIKAKELRDLRKWVDVKVGELDRLFRQGDQAAVRKLAEEVLAACEDPRVRQYLNWAKTKKPIKIDWRLVAAAICLPILAFVIWFMVKPGETVAGELQASKSDLSFSYKPGEPVVPVQTFQLKGKPAGATWVVRSSAKWFQATPPEPNGDSPITVQVVEPQKMTPGDYSGVVTISAKAKNISVTPVDVTVHLSVKAPPPPALTLQVTPRDLSFEYRRNGALPPDQTIELTGNPAGERWVSKSSDSWFTAAPAERVGDGPVTIHVDPQGLGVGEHSGVVTVSARQAAVTPVTVRVRVSVLAPEVLPPTAPELTIQPRTLIIQFRRGDKAPAAQSLTVSGKPGNEAWQVAGSDPWIAASPAQLTGDGQISIQVSPNGLSAGDHNGSVTVTSKRMPSVRSVVAVKLTIQEPPTQPLLTVVDCNADSYTGAHSGTDQWPGLLPAGQSVTIGRDNVVIAAPGAAPIKATGRAIPGCPISVTPATPGIEISEPPSAANNWGRITLKNTTSSDINGPKFTWEAKK